MADQKGNNSQEEERKIPVFTVMKKGAILKNIFLLDKPPAISEPKSIEEGANSEKSSQENDEILLVGRHPDCNIMLEHPSISRFHLRIHSQPSSQKLSVIDLSSGHGTWVSAQKIKPQVEVELNEGDTLRLGASTRNYRLHWIPLSRAFDIENPLILPSDALPLEEKEETDEDENSMSFVKKQTPSAPPIPETMNSSFSDEEDILSMVEMFEETKNQTPTRKRLEQKDISSFWSGPLATESVNSSLPVEVALSEALDQRFDKENESPQAFFSTEVLSERENQESPPRRSEKKCLTTSLWSRRGKPASVLQIQTGWSRGKNNGDCIDAGAELENQEIKDELISKVLFSGLDGEEEEIFTPDKENFTPNTLLLKSMKKGKVKEIKNSTSSPLKVTCNSNSPLEEEMFFSPDKENQTSKILREGKKERPTSRNRARLEPEAMTKRRAERVPFHSLLANSPCKSKSEVSVPNATTRSSNSVNCAQSMEKINTPSYNHSVEEAKKRWNMVVDATCLLNKESRKALKLLQGLKGTQLIIPRMVIRELDCLNRRGSLFRRATEVSSVLQWIEECMVETKWWIHVQSSVEEGMPVAPTPPASPRGTRLSQGSGGFASGASNLVPFSTCGSLLEIVSPTAEDHILECALIFKRIKNDGQLVLLTNDVTLKIKAMAEGLICETAEEFRASLVNPYSERFLWTESTPRGATWSCLDDVILKENYYQCPIKKKTSKASEAAKGLKLILLHNSQYGLINSLN
ncbi:hypothetical protein HHK36_004412 [Tetracentron sinense]|uniref:FHA domain-containing protein n=1 Tax=Tetracentron sinense TaxID=13715 RepID=A0A835DPF9_TETSI|nr:hypothetical protein HHK36_004412 [Tetracentron sinense]